MNAPASRLDTLSRLAQLGRRHGDGDVIAISERLAAWDGAQPLERHLGLKRDIDLGKLLKRRNSLLRRLRCRHLPAGFSCEADAQDMARQLSAYFGDAWQQDRIMAVCPYRRDSLLEGYWCVLKLVPHPLSARHLRRILAIQ